MSLFSSFHFAQLILPYHRAGLRLHHAQTVAREVGAVGGIDTNQGFHLLGA